MKMEYFKEIIKFTHPEHKLTPAIVLPQPKRTGAYSAGSPGSQAPHKQATPQSPLPEDV